MSNERDIFDDADLKRIFDKFSRAVESKDLKALNRLISDQYFSESLMNKNKEQLISFIMRTVPYSFPLFQFKLDIEFERRPERKDDDTYEMVIKPNYEYRFLGFFTVAQGIFGRADTVFIRVKKNPRTELYQISSMEDLADIGVLFDF